MVSADENSASLEGYYYHFKEKVRDLWANKSLDEWWPGDPTTEEFAMAYTLYIDKGSVGMNAEIEKKYSIEVFPNPASNFVIIRGNWGNKTLDKINCQLINTTGKVLVTKDVEGSDCTIKTNNFTPGIYLLRICVGTDIINKKIIIQ